MADIEITQKEIENKLFDFIEENFSKKRYECFNEVLNFVEKKLMYDWFLNDEELEDLKIDNEELESKTEDLISAFNSLKEDSEDVLNELDSKLDDLNDMDNLSEIKDKISKIKSWLYKETRKIETADIY